MNTNRIPVAILARVSTSKQNNDRQVAELQAYADANGYDVIEICLETISGRADARSRGGLQRVEQLARTGLVRKVLVHEISRISRRCSVAHKFVETLEDLGVSLYWRSQNIETLLPDGRRNPAASVLLAVMAEFARSEVEILRERVVSGLEEARRRGVVLGRRKGSTISREVLLRSHADIIRQLRSGQSIRNAAKITGKGVSTVQRVKLLIAEAKPAREDAVISAP